jgi:hypothetical protein
LQVDVKVGCFDEPVFASIPAIEGDPIHGAFGEPKLLCYVSGQSKARDHGVFQSRSKHRSRFVEVAAGKIFFKWRRAYYDAVQFHGNPCRSARDLQFFGNDAERTGEGNESCKKREFRAGSHGSVSQ